MKNKYLQLLSYSLSIFSVVLLSGCSLGKHATADTKEIPAAPGTTGNAQNLTRETNEPGSEFYPRVSPDGKYLLYTSVEKENSTNNKGFGKVFNNLINTANQVEPQAVGKIVKKEIGSQIRNPLITDAIDATWTSDGNSILFSYRKPKQPVIVKTNKDGIGLNYISQAAMGQDDKEPNVTSDESTVIFTTIVGNSRMICSMDIKGGKFTVLTDGDHVSINPKDGNKIIYNLKVNNKVQIFTMNLKTGQKTQLTSGDYDCRDGAFSPDGNWIAFASNQEDPKSKNYHIYIMRTDGTNMKQLTQGKTDEGDVCWSPDFWVFFYSNSDNNYNIWKVKPLM